MVNKESIGIDNVLTKDRNMNTFKTYCKRRKSGARFPDRKANNRLCACHCIAGNENTLPDQYRTKLYCKSRIFRNHVIFVYFVRGGFRTKTKCILNIQSKSENPQQLVAVRKFHAYEMSRVPRTRKFSVNEIFWSYSICIGRGVR